MAEPTTPRFPIAVIGASAGGVPAMQTFFNALPGDVGIGFIIVMHLAPKGDAHLKRIIQAMTQMPVLTIEDGQAVLPNHVYVGPPEHYVSLSQGVAKLSTMNGDGAHMPIDWTLRSLAEDQGEQAVAIVLSGHGIEGTAGLLEVKSAGGLALVQNPETANAPSMPQSAALTRNADYVLAPAELAETLARYAQMRARTEVPFEALGAETPHQLPVIIALLRHRTRYNFEPYKHGTLIRRIRRRMGLRHIDKVDDYLALLRTEREEVDGLARDLLIRVTHFFRDPEAWDALRDQALVPLVDSADASSALRVWVPGCATGQEAYSLAMLLLELSEARHKTIKLQVFATDIGDQAASLGREGIYAASSVADLSPERVAKFFVRLPDGRYQVSKLLRECVVFAEQDLISDPPFSRMDLIICRNVLIYLEPDVQQKIIALFHFGLIAGGYLFLGPAETVGQHDDLFIPLNKRWRIFQRVGATRLRRVQFPVSAPGSRVLDPVPTEAAPRESSFARLAQQVLLERFAPASVLITPDYDILYYCGPTHRYLTQPAGIPTQNLVDLAGESLRSKIRGAVHRAIQQHEDVAVIGVGGADITRRVKLTVSPVLGRRPTAQAMTLLVTFEEVDTSKRDGPRTSGELDIDETVIAQLEHELGMARDDLQATIEQLETSNEELKAANEEVTSMNEELQSTNEELETSKEELQSLNEELTTVNSQLQTKVEELEETTNDLQNLLASTHIATLFLDTEFRIKRFTPAITDLLHLIPSDVGRVITDFSHKFTENDLLMASRRVLDTLAPSEAEVRTADNRCYFRRILPYRTEDNRIAGVVVTFSDFTTRKQAEEALRASEERFRQIADLGLIGIAFFEPKDGKITQANDAFLTLSGRSSDDIAKGRLQLDDLAPDDLREPLQQALAMIDKGRSRPVELRIARRDGTRLHVLFGGAVLRTGEAAAFFMDVTAGKAAEAEARALAETLERRVEERSALVRLLSDAAIISNEATDVGAALRSAMERICHELGYHAGHIWLPKRGHDGALVDAGMWWADGQWQDLRVLERHLQQYTMEPGEGLAQAAAASGLPRWTREVQAEVGWLDKQFLRRWPVRSALAFPIGVRGRVSGVVELLSSETSPMVPENLDVVARVGEQLGWVLERDESQRALKRLAAELTHVEQRERTRVADVLHDEVGQTLTAARLKLAAIGGDASEALKAELQTAMSYIESALDASRNLTLDLSPPPLRDLGLVSALGWLARDAEKRFGLKIELIVAPQVEEGTTLDERVTPLVFSAVRELLHNVAKHAGIDRATVHVTTDDRQMLLHVHDSGRGFDVAALDAKRGIKTLQDRLGWFGGRLEVTSKPDEGTEVTLSVPLAGG